MHEPHGAPVPSCRIPAYLVRGRDWWCECGTRWTNHFNRLVFSPWDDRHAMFVAKDPYLPPSREERMHADWLMRRSGVSPDLGLYSTAQHWSV